jgi:hypothetical protein
MKIRCQPDFEFKCPKDWDKLDKEIATFSLPELAHNESRFCNECEKNVYKIKTIEEYDFAARNGHCVVLFFEKQNYDGMNTNALPDESKPTLGLPRYAD